ncbi:MAG: NAD(P)H-dependent glycerol-3-phosphate dehydrogenase, partial [Burkholderiales bacterium]
MNIAILGAGAWGTALAINLAARHAVSDATASIITLWARDPAQAGAMQSRRANDRYLPGCAFPDALQVSADLRSTITGRDYLICAAPVAGLRATLRAVRDLHCTTPVIWLCKGFERPDARLPHEVFAGEMGAAAGAVLSGPSFAQEVAAGLPAALTLASADSVLAIAAAQALHG